MLNMNDVFLLYHMNVNKIHTNFSFLAHLSFISIKEC